MRLVVGVAPCDDPLHETGFLAQPMLALRERHELWIPAAAFGVAHGCAATAAQATKNRRIDAAST